MSPDYDVSKKADAFLFVLGIIFNQQVRAAQAWAAPRGLAKRLGTSSADRVAICPLDEIHAAISEAPVLHPFSETMALNVQAAAEIVAQEYGNDARAIWEPVLPAEQLVDRLCQFRGIGEHKAEVGLFLLTVEHGIAVADDGRRHDVLGRCPSLASTFPGAEGPILISP